MLNYPHATFAAQHANSNRSPKTQKLWEDLYNISYKIKRSQTILGMQNAHTEGKFWIYDFKKPIDDILPPSDIERITDHKIKLVGYDFDQIGHWNDEQIIHWIKSHDSQGGITTLSWHMKNPNLPDSNNTSNSITPMAIRSIFSNPTIQQKLNNELDRLIHFLEQLGDVPIIFRPYHEHNEDWFWWGKSHNDIYWYTHLWKYTIDYLRSHQINNILIAYSPNKMTEDYLERYPGNDYVDILGTDYYFIFDLMGYALEQWKVDVVTLQKYAKKLNKIPAITEFGNEGLNIENFWTDYLAWPIQKEGVRQLLKKNNAYFEPLNLAYVLLWRNAYEKPDHFFAPNPGNSLNSNFMELLKKNFLIFINQG